MTRGINVGCDQRIDAKERKGDGWRKKRWGENENTKAPIKGGTAKKSIPTKPIKMGYECTDAKNRTTGQGSKGWIQGENVKDLTSSIGITIEQVFAQKIIDMCTQVDSRTLI